MDGLSPFLFVGKDTVGIYYQQHIFIKKFKKVDLGPDGYLRNRAFLFPVSLVWVFKQQRDVDVAYCVLELRVKGRSAMPAFLILLQRVTVAFSWRE